MQVLNTGPPFFVRNLTDLRVNQTDILIYQFPRLADPDPQDRASLKSIELGPAGSFVQGRFPRFMIHPPRNVRGIFAVEIVLQDDNPMKLTSNYTLNIIVEYLALQINQTGSQGSNTSEPVGDLQAEILSIDSEGVVLVMFSKPIVSSLGNVSNIN